MTEQEWHDDNPFYLVVRLEDGARVVDLGEDSWLTKHRDLLRAEGVWNLVWKHNHQPLFTVVVREGDQPYYLARHIGVAGSSGENETVAFSIGKKAADGTVSRLWVIPEVGVICAGDDVDYLGVRAVWAKGPR